MYERHPTPPQKQKKPQGGAAAKKYLAAAHKTTTLSHPKDAEGGGEAIIDSAAPLKAKGPSKLAVQNVARKLARQQRWQQRAESVAAVAGDEEELMEAIEEQQQRDRYIDQILRKRRGKALGAAPPGGRRGGAFSVKAGGEGYAGTASAVGREAAKSVQDALAAAREVDRDSGDESDYYWSDAE